MFVINEEDNSIYITRGDVAFFSVSSETDDGEAFKFHSGDVIRFKVFEKKNCENVVLQKDFGIEEETEEALIYLEEKDTKIGGVISKPVDYWYEVELNPYTDPQTIVGYDEDGAKIFRLYPEGNEAEDDEPITPEDIPVVDEELDLTSTRPVQNQAIARAILTVKDDTKRDIDAVKEEISAEVKADMEKYKDEIAEEMYGDARGNRLTNVAEPEEDTDAVNKAYADAKADETLMTAISDILSAEDVSNAFCGVVTGCTVTQKRVFKCRNMIVGIIIAEEKTDAITFSFDSSVRPKEALTIYGKTFASNGGELNDICTLVFSGSFTNMFIEEGGVNASKVVFTFAYPYK